MSFVRAACLADTCNHGPCPACHDHCIQMPCKKSGEFIVNLKRHVTITVDVWRSTVISDEALAKRIASRIDFLAYDDEPTPVVMVQTIFPPSIEKLFEQYAIERRSKPDEANRRVLATIFDRIAAALSPTMHYEFTPPGNVRLLDVQTNNALISACKKLRFRVEVVPG